MTIIRELTDRLNKLVNFFTKYKINKTIGRTSETMINSWITLKNLAEKKRENSMTRKPQNNLGQCGHDLSPDWERHAVQEWENSEDPGYDTEDVLKAEEATEEVLREEKKQVQQRLEENIAD